MSAAERESVAKFIGTADSGHIAAASTSCTARPRSGNAAWNGWADAANTRFQSARAAGLDKQTTPKLKLKWAFGFPGVTTAFGTPTVVDGSVFVGAADGAVTSLDARTGCTYWTYTAAGGSSSRAGDRRAIGVLRRPSRQCLRARCRHRESALESARRRSSSGRDHRIAQARRGPLIRSGLGKRRVHRGDQSNLRMLHVPRKRGRAGRRHRQADLAGLHGS